MFAAPCPWCRSGVDSAPATRCRARLRRAAADPERPYVQLLTEDYAAAFTTPQFPNVSTAYGFLMWLNAPANEQHCCSPRWGEGAVVPNCSPSGKPSEHGRACQIQTCGAHSFPHHIQSQLIGDDLTTQRAPDDLGLGMGQSAK